MGRSDESKKLFWEDDERFADLINTVFGQGEELVSAAALREENVALHTAKGGRRFEEVQKYRDIIRKVINGANVFLIGVENQEKTHYAMPARVMMMDAMEYEKQLRKKRRSHRKRKDLKPGAEYLSGLAHNEKLVPVCTVTVYYGKEPWDGPKDLHGLLDLKGIPEKLRKIFPNYPLTLVEVYRFADWEKFRTDLREVFGFIQCSEDKTRMREFLEDNRERFEVLSKETVNFLAYVTGIEEMSVPEEKEGRFDMCKAINDMIKESREQGIEQGIEQGMEQGIIQGEKNKLMAQIEKKLKKGKTIEEIANELEEEPEVIRKLIMQMQSGE